MKKKYSLALVLIMFSGLAALFWHATPVGRIQKLNTITPNALLLSEYNECSILENLHNSKFIIDFPKSIGYKEEGILYVSIINSSDVNEKEENDSSCRISLEVKVDLDGYMIEPGSTSMASYSVKPTQRFIFKLIPMEASEKKGSVWIHLIRFSENKTSDYRTPLFVIPISIVTKSIGGISHKNLIAISSITFVAPLLILCWNLHKIKK